MSIYKTHDYEQFKMIACNRPISMWTLEKLKQSFQKHFDLRLKPIIVTKDMEIVDGQHRFLAAKELNLPIYYVVDDHYVQDKLVGFNANQKAWTMDHYINYYASQNDPYYRAFRDLKSKYNHFNTSLMLPYVSHHASLGGTFSNYVKSGKLKFDIEELKEYLKKAAVLIETLMQLRTMTLYQARHQSLHHAFKTFQKILKEKGEPVEIIFHRLMTVPLKFLPKATSKDYLEQFLEFYNYKKTKDNRVDVYEAEELLRRNNQAASLSNGDSGSNSGGSRRDRLQLG